MALFGRTKTPTTVDEALAGFITLKQQLVDLITAKGYARSESEQRIVAAKQYATDVETSETAAIAVADSEIARAENAKSVIAKLLGEEADTPAEPTPTVFLNTGEPGERA